MRMAKAPLASTSRAARDRSAFEQDALASVDSLYRTALRLTRAPADAEDLVQDTYLKAFRAADRFEPGTKFAAHAVHVLLGLLHLKALGLQFSILSERAVERRGQPARICSRRMSACPQCWASSRSTSSRSRLVRATTSPTPSPLAPHVKQ